MEIDAVIDGSSLYARAFFAAKKAEVDPVVSALRSLLGVIHHTGCTRIAMCWDGDKRKSAKNRVKKPSDYEPVRDEFQEAVTTLWNIPHYIHTDYEADDLVATLVHKRFGPEEVYRVVVVSGDKDLQQLIGCLPDLPVQYYCLNKKQVVSPKEVKARWPIQKPSQIAIALAILGDPTDNIPGIKNWGPAKLTKIFSGVTPEMTFCQVVEHIDKQVPEALKDSFYTSLEATILHKDAPVSGGPKRLDWLEPAALDGSKYEALKHQYMQTYYASRGEEPEITLEG
jgi:5'-3' exonuclease